VTVTGHAGCISGSRSSRVILGTGLSCGGKVIAPCADESVQQRPIDEQANECHRPKMAEEVTIRNPEIDPIRMFCGLPVMVAVLPMFDAVASPSR